MILHKIQKLKTIYILSILLCIILHFLYGRQWGYDTISYIRAWDKISNFQIDIWRTPTYPIFIGILKKVFGTDFLIAGVIIQHIIFLTSIRYFNLLSNYITKNEIISWWLTAIYALYPCIPTWNCFIQTEAFAIYSMVFLLYSVVKLQKEMKLVYLCSFTFWLLFHIFLRPSQIYLLPILGLGFTLLYAKNKSNKALAIKGIVCILFAGICMTFYVFSFKRTYGVFTPCGIGVLNKYCMLRKANILNEETIYNTELRKYIKGKNELYKQTKTPIDSVDLYKEAEYGIETYGLKLVAEELSNTPNETIGYYIKSLIQRIQEASYDSFLYTYLYKWTKLAIINDIIGVRLNTIYAVTLIFLLLLIHYYRQAKTIPWFSITLSLITICQLITTIIACQNEWGRLIMPAISVYLIIIGQICSSLQLSKKQHYIFE